MIDIEPVLQSKLSACAACYPMELPEHPIFPAIVYQRISTPQKRTQNGDGYYTPRFQFSLYSKTYSECRNLVSTIAGILDTKGDNNIMFALNENRMDVKEIETDLFRVILEYFVWHN